MKLLVILLCCISVLGLIAVAWAHTPPGVVYYAPGIPDDKIPIFDGDLSDWAWFPEEAIVRRDTAPRKSPDIEAGKVSKEDFDCVVYGPAWIPKMNMWAFAVKVTDDVLYAPSEKLIDSWKEDNLQWCMDADHSGGSYRGPEINSQQAQQNFFTPKQGGRVGLFPGSPTVDDTTLWWAFEEPWCYKGFVVDEKTGSYTLELAIALWDHLDPKGPEASVRHRMQAGQIIGAAFLIRDQDSESDATAISWGHLRDPAQNADAFNDFLLIEGYGSVSGVALTVKERGTFFKIPVIGWLGRLLSSARVPAVGAQIHALQEGEVKGTATADEKGKYHLQLVPGQYEVAGSLPGFIDSRPDISVAANQTTKGMDLTLSVAGAISGRVFLADAHTPLLGAEIEVLHHGVVTGTDRTGGDGCYRVGELKPGLYGVGCSAYDIGGGTMRPVVVNKGKQVKDVDFFATDLQAIVLIDTVGRGLEEAGTQYTFALSAIESPNPALRLRVSGLGGQGYGGNLVYLNDQRIGRLEMIEGYQEILFSADVLAVGENTLAIKFIGRAAGKVEDLLLVFKPQRPVVGMVEGEDYSWLEYRLAMEEKDPSRKIELLEKVVEDYPTSWVRMQANQELFKLYADQDDREKMKEYADKLATGRWPNPMAFQTVAKAYADKGIFLDQAFAYADSAVKVVQERMQEQLAPMLDTRGWVRFKMGTHKEALEDFEQATALQPDPGILYHQRKALEALGRHKEARELHKAYQLNKPAPSFALKDLAGQTVRLDDLRGEVVVLDFWATWCGPCREAMPHIQRVYEEYKEKDVVIFGINTRERDEDKVESFLKEHKITYRILLDPKGEVTRQYGEAARQYGVRGRACGGIPAFFVIDPEGLIQFGHVGYREDIFEVLSWEIEALKGAE